PAPLTVAVAAGLEAEDLLGAGGAAAGVAAEGALGAVGVAVEQEVELDEQGVAVLVDQLVGLLAAAAVVAEQRVGDGVEDGRFAATVEAGQHPQRGVAVEADLLLVLVAEEALELDALGDHACTSLIRASARSRTAPRRSSGWLVSSCS